MVFQMMMGIKRWQLCSCAGGGTSVWWVGVVVDGASARVAHKTLTIKQIYKTAPQNLRGRFYLNN